MHARQLPLRLATSSPRRLANPSSRRLYYRDQHHPPTRLVGVRSLSRPCLPVASHSSSSSSSGHHLYHSYEYDDPPPFTRTETAILSAAIDHVPEYGFTQAALTAGARSAGYLDISSNLFPQGPFAIVNYHLVTQRLALAQHAPSLLQTNDNNNDTSSSSSSSPSSSPQTSPPLNSKQISTNIQRLTIHRLRSNIPILPHLQSALALTTTSPSYLTTSLHELALLADEILFLAGSTTVTSAWYTDRAGLAAIYASAELFMTTDKSEEFVDTEAFVSRRLEEGERVRSGVGMVGKWVGMQVGGLVDGLRSQGVRI